MATQSVNEYKTTLQLANTDVPTSSGSSLCYQRCLALKQNLTPDGTRSRDYRRALGVICLSAPFVKTGSLSPLRSDVAHLKVDALWMTEVQ
jgi:hypothetical protein